MHENKLKCKKYTINLYIPTNVDTVFHSGLTSSPLQALTSKVEVVSGRSPDSLVMTVVVVEPLTVFSL